MKKLSDKVFIKKECGEYSIYIKRTFMDDFGKLYQENKLFDTTYSRDRAIEISNDRISMINCSYNV
jgi:hypothetical protein